MPGFRRSRNHPGHIPKFGQGLRAKNKQQGTDGGMSWLKRIKLHKYWPAFSHWSYDVFMSLSEETIDERLAEIGARDVAHGAKMKLVRCIANLRHRETVMQQLLHNAWSGELNIPAALDYLREVVHTPLPSDPGSNISVAIVNTVLEVLGFMSRHTPHGWMQPERHVLIRVITRRPVLENTNALLASYIFKRQVLPSTRESASVSSITATGIRYAIPRACVKEAWDWGKSESELFLSSMDKGGIDVRAQVNHHNYRHRRKLPETNAGEICNCHGTSGTRTTRTCWGRVAPFPGAGKSLMERYQKALRIDACSLSRQSSIAAGHEGEMVFLAASPAYSNPNLSTGWPRTEGRVSSRRKTLIEDRLERRELCGSCGHHLGDRRCGGATARSTGAARLPVPRTLS